MSKRNLLLIGCGDVAQRALPWLIKRFRVFAAIRRPEQAQALRAQGAVPLLADLDQPSTLTRLAGIADVVLHFAPPPAQGRIDRRSRALYAALAQASTPRVLVYISTTGVYGNCNGDWLDETRPVNAQSERAHRRLDAEKTLRQLGKRHRIRVHILRAPGIYAAERLPRERIARALPVPAHEDDSYTNHIHADDLAWSACLAIFRARPGRIYHACDDQPTRSGEYFDLAADFLQLPRPPRCRAAELGKHLSEQRLSFLRESRRLDNRRLQNELGVRLRYRSVHACLQATPASATDCKKPDQRQYRAPPVVAAQ